MGRKGVILALLALNAGEAVYYNLKVSEMAENIAKLQQSSLLYHVWASDYWSLVMTDSCRALDAGMAVRNATGESMTLSDIAEDGDILVVRYSELNCNSCVDSLMKKIGEFAERGGMKNRFVVFANYENYLDFKLFCSLNKANLNIYNVKGLPLGQEALETPYLFLLHSDMTVTNFFVTHKEMPGATDRYLGRVSELLQD